MFFVWDGCVDGEQKLNVVKIYIFTSQPHLLRIQANCATVSESSGHILTLQ